MRRTRRLILAVIVLPVAGAVVLGVEVLVARTGTDLEPTEPFAIDGTVGAGEQPPLRVVWVGDSTAAGVGASTADATLPRLVSIGLGRKVDLTVLAVSGARVADVVRDQAARAAALDPDIVVVDVGANDVTHLTRRRAFREDYSRLMTFGRARVIALGVPDMGAPPRLAQPLRGVTGWWGRRLDRAVRQEVAAQPGVTYVDIAGPTGPRFRSDPDRYFAADGFHPSDAGYRLWADAVLASLG